MRKFKVLNAFVDLEDNNHIYRVGEQYPHSLDMEISEERINELSTDQNKQHRPLIQVIVEESKAKVEIVKEEEVQEEEKPKPKKTKKKKEKE